MPSPWKFHLGRNGHPYYTAVLRKWSAKRCPDCREPRWEHCGVYAIAQYKDGEKWRYRSSYIRKRDVRSDKLQTFGKRPVLSCRCPGRRGPSMAFTRGEADVPLQTALTDSSHEEQG